ncbi:LLM class flavin-dependent oxidoreductase [Chishuiella sp.]|uniref:LLM class flavin-dependent oxidoreductase n=1 Tax=Chishuiella sp. TaxID=1969467 RepID=UPI0028B0EB6A|nr:LLM class flavin-dependent oxidoreductase [Chishuiella sp.]
MELGIGMFGDVHINEKTGYIQTPQQRMAEIIEEVKLMDEVGLDFFGIGEHHRPDYAVSSPEIILAALSTVTKNIRLGSAVSVISSTDPVKLYQDFSTVDNLSNGRAEIMAGRGSFIESFPLYGYDLNNYDELFDEKLRLLLTLNKEEVINWKGNFRKPIVNQTVYPRPIQKEIPIWIAVGGTTSSVIRAGKLGLPIIFAIIGGNPANFEPLFEVYKQAYLDNGHPEEKMQIGVHMHSFFGDDNEVVADKYFPIYGGQMDRIGASRGWPKYTRPQFDYGRSTDGHLVVGDKEMAIDKIQKYKELFGLTRFSAHMDVGAPSHLDMMKSIEIFGKDIAPRIK